MTGRRRHYGRFCRRVKTVTNVINNEKMMMMTTVAVIGSIGTTDDEYRSSPRNNYKKF